MLERMRAPVSRPSLPPQRLSDMRRITWWLTLVLLMAACGGGEDASANGQALLKRSVGDAPFFDTTAGTLLVDGRLLSSSRLGEFEVPPFLGEAQSGSEVPIGRLDNLRVGTWQIGNVAFGPLPCVGYIVTEDVAGGDCSTDDPAENLPAVYWHVGCRPDNAQEWYAFSIDERVTAIRLEFAGGSTVVGADTTRVGLVAVQGSGTLQRATAQTSDGAVWLFFPLEPPEEGEGFSFEC